MPLPKGYKFKPRKSPPPLTEEHKDKIRKNHAKYWLGKRGFRPSPSSEFKKGQKPWNYINGNIRTEEKIIRTSPEFKAWRVEIFNRDYYTCKKCHSVGGKLNAHHVNNFIDNKDLRLRLDNGITLCDMCHRAFHRKYGRKNNTAEQLNEYLNE